MIGCPDHGRRSGVHVTEFQQPGQTVCQPEDQHCLDKERDGDPLNGQRVADDYLTFKREHQDQGKVCPSYQKVLKRTPFQPILGLYPLSWVWYYQSNSGTGKAIWYTLENGVNSYWFFWAAAY